MSNMDDQPVTVTGEEHAHPSLRLLARACIALAQQRLAQKQTETVAVSTTEPEVVEKGVEENVETPETVGKSTTKREPVSEGVETKKVKGITKRMPKGRGHGEAHHG